jgi:hypothetical protein
LEGAYGLESYWKNTGETDVRSEMLIERNEWNPFERVEPTDSWATAQAEKRQTKSNG